MIEESAKNTLKNAITDMINNRNSTTEFKFFEVLCGSEVLVPISNFESLNNNKETEILELSNNLEEIFDYITVFMDEEERISIPVFTDTDSASEFLKDGGHCITINAMELLPFISGFGAHSLCINPCSKDHFEIKGSELAKLTASWKELVLH